MGLGLLVRGAALFGAALIGRATSGSNRTTIKTKSTIKKKGNR